jgi:hypothetical protein
MAKPNRDCFQKAFKDNALTIFTVLGVIGGAVLGLSLRASRYARTPNNSHSLFLNCSSSTHHGKDTHVPCQLLFIASVLFYL